MEGTRDLGQESSLPWKRERVWRPRVGTPVPRQPAARRPGLSGVYWELCLSSLSCLELSQEFLGRIAPVGTLFILPTVELLFTQLIG